MKRVAKLESTEERWHGLAVCEGVGLGRVLRIHNGVQQVYRTAIDDHDIKRELRRFRAALRLARRQVLALKKRADKEIGSGHAYIFDAHALMLDDPKLVQEVENHIKAEQSNAEWAIRVTADRLISLYAAIQDDYLRARSSDVEDVAQRLLLILRGVQPAHLKPVEGAVIVAEDMLPSAVAELDLQRVRGIATDGGGWTSHMAIIARALGIPAVVGLKDFYRRARTGDEVIVDGFRGEVVLRPESETKALYAEAASEVRAGIPEASSDTGPIRSLDGVEFHLRANVELRPEFESVRLYGAQGIGLYRSEFLLSKGGIIPGEDSQRAAYAEVAGYAGPEGAIIRLFDLGSDKLSWPSVEAERNPALGLRAIRFTLRHEEILRTQARAIFRAAATGKLSIVIPMVSGVMDVRRTREIIESQREQLQKEKIEIGEVKVGAMIEVPSAVIMANKIAREVDFFSLGTNDLVQYMLAVDRGNDEVADWFKSLHPAVLYSIHRTIQAAREAAIPVMVCGEMAGTPAYAAVLAGLGARDLSMTASSIPRVRNTLSSISVSEASSLANECLSCETADEVERIVSEKLARIWPELFPPKTLPASKYAG